MIKTHKWIKDGCPKINDHLFRNNYGLCGNYTEWCIAGNKKVAQEPFHFNSPFPFNTSTGQYSYEANTATIYQNAERLAYIKKYL